MESNHHYEVDEKRTGITLKRPDGGHDIGVRAILGARNILHGGVPLPRLEPENVKGFTFVHPDGSFDTGIRAALNSLRVSRGEDPKLYKRTYVRVNHSESSQDEPEWNPGTEEVLAAETLDASITSALDGYAKDGETWTQARKVFYANLRTGATPYAALKASLESAEDGAESSAEDAGNRFLFDLPLAASLDGYAKDGATWTHAREVFFSALGEKNDLPVALEAALHTAEDGAESDIDSAKERFFAANNLVGRHFATAALRYSKKLG